MNLAFRYISRLSDQSPRLLGALCLAILLIILVAGLWPFNFLARNKVAWLPDQDGVHFYGQGIIASTEPLNNTQKPLFPDKSITLEILLRPLLVTGNLPHILTLYDGHTPDIFFVGQWKSHLIIRSRADNPTMRKKGKTYGEIGLKNTLQKDQDCFLTITSGAGGTAIYPQWKIYALLCQSPHARRYQQKVLSALSSAILQQERATGMETSWGLPSTTGCYPAIRYSSTTRHGPEKRLFVSQRTMDVWGYIPLMKKRGRRCTMKYMQSIH